jgi:hypothetical protein
MEFFYAIKILFFVNAEQPTTSGAPKFSLNISSPKKHKKPYTYDASTLRSKTFYLGIKKFAGSICSTVSK